MIKEHKFEFILTLLIIIIAVIGIIIAIKNNNLSNQTLDNFKIIL
ncbi:unknown [Firmicutes bacterium CAG:449]|nr:unknown [Firmicutes bacterium CAG:449]